MMSHQKIVEISAKWLKKHYQNILIPNCSIIGTELHSFAHTGEIPDVIGWSTTESVLLEIKLSRSDFLKDKKKPFRKDINLGVGTYRYYVCPKGLIDDTEIPDTWGLIYISTLGEVDVKQLSIKHNSNMRSENAMLLALLRKLIARK